MPLRFPDAAQATTPIVGDPFPATAGGPENPPTAEAVSKQRSQWPQKMAAASPTSAHLRPSPVAFTPRQPPHWSQVSRCHPQLPYLPAQPHIPTWPPRHRKLHPAVSKLAAANLTAHQRTHPATGPWTCHCGLQTAEKSSLPLRRLSIRVRSAFAAVPRPQPTTHPAHSPPQTAGRKQLWRHLRRQQQTQPCSTGSMRPSHAMLISHANPRSTGSMHSSHVALIHRTTKFFFLLHLS